MKKEIVMWLIIAVLVVGLLLGTQKAETMAVNFTANDQAIVYDANSQLNSASSISVAVAFKRSMRVNIHYLVTNLNDAGTTGFLVGIRDNSLDATQNHNKLTFIALTSGDLGIWETGANTILDNTEYTVSVTYDASSVLNDPVIQINGAVVAITEIVTPTGTINIAGDKLVIGNAWLSSSYDYGMDGIIRGAKIYNAIHSSASLADIYTSRWASYPKNSLVSCPFLKGAAGLQIFDGATLAAGNTIVDPCSGAVGVPAGDPVGVGETYLR